MPEYCVTEAQNVISLAPAPTHSNPNPVPILTYEVKPDPCSFKWEMALMRMLARAWVLNHPGSVRL